MPEIVEHATADRLIFVHGFTQTAASWGPIFERLDPDAFETVALDAPGHGRRADARASLDEGAALIGAVGGVGTYIGYSMGARFVLHLALAQPELVQRLVLVSGTAGIDDSSERADRRVADEALADSIERDGVSAFIDRWLAGPMFATLPDEAAGRAERLTNTAGGLASSLRLAGTGTQEPLWDRVGELAMPTLVVAGALDTKFTALAHRLGAAIPDSTVVIVPAAGHTVHLEQPQAFVDILVDWLGTH